MPLIYTLFSSYVPPLTEYCDDISFEENKAEILNLIKATKQAFENGEIEAKDALKIEADLRVKLNDKFSVTEDVKDQIVVVNQKYDAICGRCG